MRINLICVEDEDVYPIYCSKLAIEQQQQQQQQQQQEHQEMLQQCLPINHITLVLYLMAPDAAAAAASDSSMSNKLAINHYCYVENLDKFLRKQYKSKLGKSYQRGVRCPNCFAHFANTEKEARKKALSQHYELCLQNKTQAIEVPKEGENVLTFKNHANKFKNHFVGYVDFEAAHIAPEQREQEGKTRVVAEQRPVTVAYLIMDKHDRVKSSGTYAGEDCVEQWIKLMLKMEPELMQVLSKNEKMIETPESRASFARATLCHICEKPLGEDRVKDHCHVEGIFLGAAHNVCNLKRLEKRRIYFFAHNLSGYDSHFIIRAIGKIQGITHLSGLPSNSEKFRTLRFNNFVMIDSAAFLHASLSELVDDLAKDRGMCGSKQGHRFKILDQSGLYDTRKPWLKELLLKKAAFPYEYVTSLEIMKKTREIPDISHFFSSLNNSTVSAADYEHSKTVFKAFNCRHLLDFCRLYNLLDVFLLAECITKFRKVIMKEVGLEVTNYISLPQMALDMMLKTTGVEIELPTDINIINLFEAGIRGGVSFVAQRYAKEEDVVVPMMDESTGEEVMCRKRVQLALWDANNLYGLAQIEPQPLSGFRWLTVEEVNNLDLMSMTEDQETGFVLEVDLSYPAHLHREHGGFPLAPHHVLIKHDMLSPYARGKWNNNSNCECVTSY